MVFLRRFKLPGSAQFPSNLASARVGGKRFRWFVRSFMPVSLAEKLGQGKKRKRQKRIEMPLNVPRNRGTMSVHVGLCKTRCSRLRVVFHRESAMGAFAAMPLRVGACLS